MTRSFLWRRLVGFTACAIACTLSFTSAIAQSDEQARFTAEDLLDIVTVNGESITVSPDGEWVAFAYPDMDDETNVLSRRPTGYIHVKHLADDAVGDDDGEIEKLSQGSIHTSFPAWSPDSRQLAYFVNDSNGTHLEVWDIESGEKQQVGSSFTGDPYLAPEWDSSGKLIVFARAVDAPEPDTTLFPPPPTFTRAVQGRDKEDVPRVVVLDSDDKRIPGDAVFVDRRKATLAVFDLSNDQEVDITNEPVHLRHFQVSPSGMQVTYTIPTKETIGLIGGEVLTTFLVSLDGTQARRLSGTNFQQLRWGPAGEKVFYLDAGTLFTLDLTDEKGVELQNTAELSINNFSWSPDGKWLAALVSDDTLVDPELVPAREGMYSIARPFNDLYIISTATGKTRNVTEDFTDQLGDPVWSSDRKSVFFRTIDVKTYDEYIYEYDVGSSRLNRLTGGGESFDNLEAYGDTLLFTAQSALHPPNIFAVNTKKGLRRQITNWNPQLSKFEFSKPELLNFVGGDGEKLSALLYRPVDVSPSTQVPVITYVYEKLTPQRHHFSARHQFFLNHGFAVLMPNVKVQVGATGTSFVKSVVPATDAVRSMGFTNGKFAIWGGSFGAYATAYIITQTDLFACAVARATPPDLFANWASGRDRDSRNIESGQARMGGSPFEVMERYLSQSAFFQLDKVETPILIMHGAQDTTILFHEGEMLFYALRQLGKEARFVAYTYGDHSLYRHSRIDAIDVHNRLLDWFNHCIK